ncbi:MAG: hypothetical protein LKF41_07805 [Bifidobacterium sp.]|jgi:hypothetical protein|nr:hypothetical protein [Bifidobacterium sp.]
MIMSNRYNTSAARRSTNTSRSYTRIPQGDTANQFAEPVLLIRECQRAAQECRIILARIIADCNLTVNDIQLPLASAKRISWQGSAAQYFRKEILSLENSLHTIAEGAQTLGQRPDFRAL